VHSRWQRLPALHPPCYEMVYEGVNHCLVDYCLDHYVHRERKSSAKGSLSSCLNSRSRSALDRRGKFSVAQAVMQVCLASGTMRGAIEGAALGGVPPSMDFVVQLKERPALESE